MSLLDPPALTRQQADARYTNRLLHGLLPSPICAGRSWRPIQFSNLTNVTFQRVFRLYGDAPQVRLVFSNLAMQGSPQENSAGAFTLKVGVVFGLGGALTNVSVTFSGVRSVTLAQYQTLVSDPVDLPSTSGDGTYFAVVSYITQAGTFLPTGQDTNATGGADTGGFNEGYLAGDFSDATNSFGGATGGVSFGPWAVCGWPTSGKNKAVFLAGDSIVVGTGWEIGGLSFTSYACQQNKLGAINLARSGETLAVATTYTTYYRRIALAAGCAYAMDEYGTNDIGNGTSTAAIKALMLSFWAYLARRGMKVYRTTIIPRTNSTDNWQTVGGQTLFAGSAQETVRQQLNQWLRAPASAGAGNSAIFDAAGTLAGVFSTAAAVEVNADGSAIAINATTGAISNGVGGFFKTDATIYDSGTVTSIPNSQKLTDTTKVWATSQWIGYSMVIVTDSVTPAAVGQFRIISANTNNTLTTSTAWTTTPSTSATYKIVRTFSMDGIHPTAEGHKLMAAAIPDFTQ